MRHSFDVLVAGGGPAGSAAALDLSRRGLSVALIEQDNYQTPRVGETLPPMIRQQLTGLGVWQRFLESGPLESYGIQTAWETPAPRHQDFLQNPYGCGWHVDRAGFDAMLACAAAEAGAELMLDARVCSCQRKADGQWRLEVARGGTTQDLSGRNLVDATGRKALLASRLGSQAHVADRLIGAVAFSHSSETAQWTLIEAVEDGWWYSAPLPGGRMVFAYMTDSDLWKEPVWGDLLKLAPLTFERAGSREVPPPVQIVSAASAVHCPVTGPNWIAIGDAALAFDPLSGQGVFKSIETGTRSASAIARHFDGDPSALAEYEGWVNESYLAYLSERGQFYGSVRRWPGSRFWQRRTGV
ncbi:MAG TPA: FAD-dependent oxidoreductase [Terriglobales bacterium]|nr:FAD-dependent oxidoreductase [Terriglobales bacterium]